jgi:RNA polymerase sigma-70 factor (ECF subfamily)
VTDDEIASDMMALRPTLVSFARALCGDLDYAEDIASEAIARAWKHRTKFEPGTSLRAWLFVIARNLFISEKRRGRWNGGYLEDMPSVVAKLSQRASQEDHLILKDVEKAFALMPKAMVDAVMSVVLNGTYEEAAEADGCYVGTIKSRVSRGRDTLNGLLA